ncbi:MAG: hypothetical protein K6T86_15550, partial [Pirellulales bacterium]|nr:hypothetical protein [Pirellulales bacterium]
DVTGASPDDLEPITSVLQRMAVDCRFDGDVLQVRESAPRAVRKITTGVWPGFPSDMVSLVTVLAIHADGRTLVHDWMYELRLFALEQLSGMRADLFLCDPHRIIVSGPSALRGRMLDSRDLRSGMALIAAAVSASSSTMATRNVDSPTMAPMPSKVPIRTSSAVCTAPSVSFQSLRKMFMGEVPLVAATGIAYLA